MDLAGPEAQLRSLVAESLLRLDDSHGGRFLAEVARHVGVERSTVSRWRRAETTPQPTHTQRLVQRWPEYFPADEIMALHLAIARGGLAGPAVALGAEVLEDPAAIFQAGAAMLATEPANPRDRVYRHVAFHLDRLGRDPMEEDALFRAPAGPALGAFRAQVARRAAQGWDVTAVVSTGNPARLPSIRAMVEAIDGPNVEIFAYPLRLPLAVAPLMIANRHVLFCHDHRRWERPSTALLMSSTSVSRWVDDYVKHLVAEAPFRLRSPAGVDPPELASFWAAVSAAAR